MCIPDAIRSKERGLSLVELIMFIAVVGIGIAGILQVMSLTTRNSVDPQLRKQALSIAEGLLEEVQRSHFTFCDPSDGAAATAATPAACAIPEKVGQANGEPVNARPYDNVNDYVNEFNKAVDYPKDVVDNPITVNGVYTAKITISPEPALGPSDSVIAPDGGGEVDGEPAGMEALRIRVTVSYNNDRDSITLDGFRTRYAPQALP
jgi:MSHA pilin protein MshD